MRPAPIYTEPRPVQRAGTTPKFEASPTLVVTADTLRTYSPFRLPAIGRELGPKVYPPSKDDSVRRETFPINPCNLITSLRWFRPCPYLIPPLLDVVLAVPGFLPLPLLTSDITAGMRVIVVPMEGKLCGRAELPDAAASDGSGDRYGGVDLVLGMASGFVDEGGSKGGVSREPECTATHHGIEGGISED